MKSPSANPKQEIGVRKIIREGIHLALINAGLFGFWLLVFFGGGIVTSRIESVLLAVAALRWSLFLASGFASLALSFVFGKRLAAITRNKHDILKGGLIATTPIAGLGLLGYAIAVYIFILIRLHVSDPPSMFSTSTMIYLFFGTLFLMLSAADVGAMVLAARWTSPQTNFPVQSSGIDHV